MLGPLFGKYQQELLTFANTDFGREYLDAGFGQRIEKNDQIIKVTPDGFHVLKDFVRNQPIIQATFYPYSPYIALFGEALESLDAAREFRVLKQVQQEIYRRPAVFLTHPYVMFSTLTAYPDADPESTSVDGGAGRSAVDQTWANIRAGAGNTGSDTLGNVNWIYAQGSTTSNQWAELDRWIALFDTSSIGAGQVVSAATYSLYGTDKADANSWSAAHIAMALVSSSPASNTAIANADYGNLGSTRLTDSDFAYSSWSTTGYNDFTLNSSGIANINITGISKFGSLFACDLDNGAPAWTSGGVTRYKFNAADVGSNKPKLVVTYALPSGGMPIMYA